MMSAAGAVVARLRARIEAHQATLGLVYPWWLPLFGFAGIGGCALTGVAQRGALDPPGLMACAVLVVLAPAVVDLVRGGVSCELHSAIVIAGTAWILSRPASGASAIDFGPGVLIFLSAEITAKSPRRGLVTTAASVALLFGAAAFGLLPGVWADAVETLGGTVVGFVLYYQMRALLAERRARAHEHERATLAERARISREVHDLTAHSLTVTLLHLTGARRLLEEGDLAEASAALADAEQAGRAAMTDIRRTIGSRTRAGDPVAPLPTARDLPGLVGEVRRAGLAVEYSDGLGDEAGRLDASVGLGLYRIVQESLANAARHAPGSAARLSVSLTGGRLRASVRNPAPSASADAVSGAGTGSGLAGMAARAEQLGGTLTAGPDGGDWRVDLDLPAGPSFPGGPFPGASCLGGSFPGRSFPGGPFPAAAP